MSMSAVSIYLIVINKGHPSFVIHTSMHVVGRLSTGLPGGRGDLAVQGDASVAKCCKTLSP